ncbi:hypothetical protein Taro_025054 [Colocasia esculenta]|uniref:Uncharacterized protein n=1 Tax=Colocasia esculenta TaxID=4460 RepID=A0A843VGE2_COLES|nr:hypothetical protein [Colocasia esculenta]
MAMSSSAQTSCAAPAKNHRVASVGRHSDAQVNCERRFGSCQLGTEGLSRPEISEPFLVRSEVSEKGEGVSRPSEAGHPAGGAAAEVERPEEVIGWFLRDGFKGGDFLDDHPDEKRVDEETFKFDFYFNHCIFRRESRADNVLLHFVWDKVKEWATTLSDWQQQPNGKDDAGKVHNAQQEAETILDLALSVKTLHLLILNPRKAVGRIQHKEMVSDHV